MNVETRSITCEGGLPAYVATPRNSAASPLIVLMHERYGLVRHTRDLAERFAREGYACIAPDFFHRHPDQEALHRGDVGYELSDPEAIESLDAAIAQMREHPSVDVARTAIVGVCQTGRYPLVYGAHRRISSAIAWYGAASKREWSVSEIFPVGLDELIGRLPCPVLGLFGEGDHVISLDDVGTLRASLERHRKSYSIEIFAGAPHGWLNDTMPGRYRREQAEAAWTLQSIFLEESLSPTQDRSTVRQSYKAGFSEGYDFTKNVRME